MKIKYCIQSALSDVFGVKISRYSKFGTLLFEDVSHLLPRFKANTIFDVGANVGQSTAYYCRTFRKSRIVCFEPVQSTYEKLCAFASGKPNVETHRLALGSIDGDTVMLVGNSESSGMNCLHSVHPEASSVENKLENVPISTLDSFCKSHGISHIDFLKIDAEGADLDVLKGARQMLRDMSIDLFQVEVGMNGGNEWHIPFGVMCDYAQEFEYLLFGVYDQVPETMFHKPWLRRANLVFVSKKFGDLNGW